MPTDPAALEKPLETADALAAMWDFATPRARESWCAFTGKFGAPGCAVARQSAEQDWCHLFEFERAALMPVMNEFARLRREANQAYFAQIEARKGQPERRASLMGTGK